MQPIIITLTAAVDADGVAESQTPGGAGDLTLDGALVTGGVAIFDNAQKASITTLGDETGVTFSFVGKDADGFAATESILGGNIDTVKTVSFFTEISQVSVDGATAAAVTVGSANEAATKTLPVDWRQNSFDMSIAVILSSGADLTYETQHTLDSIQTVTAPFAWLTNDGMTGKIVSDDGNLKFPVRAVRLVFTGFTSGEAEATFLQSGYKSC